MMSWISCGISAGEEAKTQQKIDLLLSKLLERQITDNEFNSMKSGLVDYRAELQDRRRAIDKTDEDTLEKIAKIGKLLKEPYLAYIKASELNRRLLVRSMVENIQWDSENLQIHWKKEFQLVADRNKNSFGSALTSGTLSLEVFEGVLEYLFL